MLTKHVENNTATFIINSNHLYHAKEEDDSKFPGQQLCICLQWFDSVTKSRA